MFIKVKVYAGEADFTQFFQGDHNDVSGEIRAIGEGDRFYVGGVAWGGGDEEVVSAGGLGGGKGACRFGLGLPGG